MEIEKKFRVISLPDGLENREKKEIEQGYLNTDPVLRIRKSNNRYILTVKSHPQEGKSGVRICEEFETDLSQSAYEHLREKADAHLIQKTRYLIPLPDGHTGELDVFGGRLEGLCFIEVEFDSAADAEAFCPPVWFGKNVSDDKRYSNSFLSRCDVLDADMLTG